MASDKGGTADHRGKDVRLRHDPDTLQTHTFLCRWTVWWHLLLPWRAFMTYGLAHGGFVYDIVLLSCCRAARGPDTRLSPRGWQWSHSRFASLHAPSAVLTTNVPRPPPPPNSKTLISQRHQRFSGAENPDYNARIFEMARRCEARLYADAQSLVRVPVTYPSACMCVSV